MKKFIESFFYKKNYFILTPKIHSFGGFFEKFYWGLKTQRYLNKKLILAVPFIDANNHYYGKSIKFDFQMIKKKFYSLSKIEKFLSVALSLYINFSLILKKIKIKGFLFLLFGRDRIDNIFFEHIGFYNDENIYQIKDLNNVYKSKIDENLFSKDQFFISKFDNKKCVAICIKDNNYSLIKDISGHACADISEYRKTIDFLIKNNFIVIRVGEPHMCNFNYINDNFFDFTKDKNYYNYFLKTIQMSNFYLCTSGSHSYVGNLYSANKIIADSIDFIYLGQSFDYNDVTIFKKIYDIEKKKVLSFTEIYNDSKIINNFFSHKNNKDYIFLNNSSDEILELVSYHLSEKKFTEDHKKRLSEFKYLRQNSLTRNFYEKNIGTSKLFENCVTDLPPKYLENFLYPGKYLDELSEKITSENFK